MDAMTDEILRTLAQGCDETCVSIFLPTERAGLGIREDSVRLKNLLDRAEQELRDRDVRPDDVARILQPGRTLADDFLFWQHQGEGLALFLSKEMSRIYRLPVRFNEEVHVGQSFHVGPLVPLISGDDHFFILTLQQKQGARLLRATRDSVTEVDLPGVPENVADSNRDDTQHSEQLQFHTANQGNMKQQSPRPAMFHGSNADSRSRDDEIEHYFKKVDRALRDALRDENVPLVLAGVEFLIPIYHRANTYKRLLDEYVDGAPGLYGDDGLRERAWAIVSPTFDEDRRAAVDRYNGYRGTGHASADLGEIVSAAAYGRIDSLLVRGDQHVWGNFDPDTGAVEVHDQEQAGDSDLLELATAYTLLRDGAVYWMPPEMMPESTPMAATFRYSMSGG